MVKKLPLVQVWLVSASTALSTAVRRALPQHQIDLRVFSSHEAVLDRWGERPPQLFVVDWELAQTATMTVCADIRSWSTRPIVLLLPAAHATTLGQAFDEGVDECVLVPFQADELWGRVAKLLGRSRQQNGAHAQLLLGAISIHLDNYHCQGPAGAMTLTHTEWKVLQALAAHAGATLTYQQLIHQVWGMAADEKLDTLRMHMKRLRRKLEPNPEAPQFLQTDIGIGYRLVLPTVQHDPPAHEASLVALPRYLMPLLGREQAIASLVALLTQPDVRIVTLVGSGGIGKTRLAVAVAQALSNETTQRIYFVPLAEITHPDVVLPTIARVMGIEDAPHRSVPTLIERHLTGTPTVLVLDNFEHVVDAVPAIRVLLDRLPALTILVTSRATLQLGGEHIYRVPPLDLPEHEIAYTPATLMDVPAIALFVRHAQAIDTSFTVTPGNSGTITAICRRLDGIPLALELAAARMRVLAPDTMLLELERDFSVLRHERHDLAPRHRSLHQTIAWSYDAMSLEVQQMVTRLSVFRGGWTAEAADHVAIADDASTRSSMRCLDCLTMLLDHSLITAYVRDHERRFDMVEMIRDYVTHYGHADTLPAARAAHAAYYLALAEMAAPELTGGEQQRWADRLDREYPNLRVALQWLLETKQHAVGFRLGRALTQLWIIRSHYHEGLYWLDALLAADPDTRSTIRADVLYGAGTIAATQGTYAPARVYLHESLTLFQHHHDQAGAAKVLNSLARIAHDLYDVPTAMRLSHQVLAIYQSLNDQAGAARILANMSILLTYQDRYAEALDHGQESLRLHREAGNQRGMAFALSNLGLTYLYQHVYDRAATCFTEALIVRQHLADTHGRAMSLSHLGLLALYQGKYAEATECYRTSLQLFQEIEDHRFTAICYKRLADIALAQERFDLARTYLQPSLAQIQHLNDPAEMIQLLVRFGLLALHAGQRTRAVQLSGAITAAQEQVFVYWPPRDKSLLDALLKGIQHPDGPLFEQTAWTTGQQLRLEDAVSYALEAIPAV